MNQQNLDILGKQLLALGCDPVLGGQLQCQACFSPAQFDLQTSRSFGEDVCQVAIRVEKNEIGLYQFRYYNAVLRKKIILPKELTELDKRMGGIDWVGIAKGRREASILSPDSVRSAHELLGAIEAAGITADLLRYKYWQGTELESLIQQAAAHKNAWEISERVYFFEELEVIPITETVRFLNSRWMEKQMVVRKKLIEKVSDEKPPKPGHGLLIKKKRNAPAKRNLFKS